MTKKLYETLMTASKPSPSYPTLNEMINREELSIAYGGGRKLIRHDYGTHAPAWHLRSSPQVTIWAKGC